jgi:DNA (cytosine-5)-methyltransferase 1
MGRRPVLGCLHPAPVAPLRYAPDRASLYPRPPHAGAGAPKTRRKPLRCLDLFSGIGGFALGFERAGIRTVQFCETDPYACAVLKKHWPRTPIHGDIRTFYAEEGHYDVICGGFPCQDISAAGKGAGLDGSRSSLWWEFHRIIEEAKPRWVVIENVPTLRSRGLDRVLGSLATLGFDSEFHCIPAAALGAPHRRDRIWIVANANGAGRSRSGSPQSEKRQRDSVSARPSPDVANTQCIKSERDRAIGQVANTKGMLQKERNQRQRVRNTTRYCGPDAPHAHRPRLEKRQGIGRDACAELQTAERANWRIFESGLGGIADGLPLRLDRHHWTPDWEAGVPRTENGTPNRIARLRCLGNTIIPQIAEIIARAIVAADRRLN